MTTSRGTSHTRRIRRGPIFSPPLCRTLGAHGRASSASEGPRSIELEELDGGALLRRSSPAGVTAAFARESDAPGDSASTSTPEARSLRSRCCTPAPNTAARTAQRDAGCPSDRFRWIGHSLGRRRIPLRIGELALRPAISLQLTAGARVGYRAVRPSAGAARTASRRRRDADDDLAGLQLPRRRRRRHARHLVRDVARPNGAARRPS